MEPPATSPAAKRLDRIRPRAAPPDLSSVPGRGRSRDPQKRPEGLHARFVTRENQGQRCRRPAGEGAEEAELGPGTGGNVQQHHGKAGPRRLPLQSPGRQLQQRGPVGQGMCLELLRVQLQQDGQIGSAPAALRQSFAAGSSQAQVQQRGRQGAGEAGHSGDGSKVTWAVCFPATVTGPGGQGLKSQAAQGSQARLRQFRGRQRRRQLRRCPPMESHPALVAQRQRPRQFVGRRPGRRQDQNLPGAVQGIDPRFHDSRDRLVAGDLPNLIR